MKERGKPQRPKGLSPCGCEWLQITEALWLCPHAAYGEATIGSGVVEDARRMLERAGGYAVLLARLHRTQRRQREDAAAAHARAF